MKISIESGAFTATDVRVALSRLKPGSTHGAVPVLDRFDALQALAADVGTQQHEW